jgi:hypothetical protein
MGIAGVRVFSVEKAFSVERTCIVEQAVSAGMTGWFYPDR